MLKLRTRQVLTTPAGRFAPHGARRTQEMDEFERGVQAGVDLARRQERSFVDGWRAGAAAAFDALGQERDERLMVLVRQGPKYAWEKCDE